MSPMLSKPGVYCTAPPQRSTPHILPWVYQDIDDSSESESSESTIFPSELSPTDSSVICGQNTLLSNLSSSSASQASSSSESGPEVWDETSDSSSSDESDSDLNCAVDDAENLRFIVCLFLAFFQLCHRVSDRALSHLLSFLFALLNHLMSYAKGPPIVNFIKNFPTTIYSLRKHIKQEASTTTYVVCPRCHSLYQQSQCSPIRDSFGIFSPKCDYVPFPNHLQRAHKKKCGADLMKKVKLGQTYKFVPRKMYAYYSIIDTLQRLVSRTAGMSKVRPGGQMRPEFKLLAARSLCHKINELKALKCKPSA